ncbi:TetR/AcrR family transcriptional regulator [Actinocorallia populi]|uniref:TetR/AcrR family transcriptional regulator n=1 Tax=Actinocorallia populi TaxID=2079200 RepID=UPI000D08914A|nr:TetR/AcrR family transcriptional regulator [Actinocorallia populi]
MNESRSKKNGRSHADQGQRRASLAQARSRETKHALLQAAIALWRTKGFAETTVADICKAAGVSKALFYFYFPRKEDALLEAGFLSTRDARHAWRDLVAQPYDLSDVIYEVLAALERTMRRNPPELLIHATLEGYRAEQRALAEDLSDRHHTTRFLFLGLLEHAQADGRLPAGLDVLHLARVIQSLLETGTRHWAAGEYGDRTFTEVVGHDINAFITGYSSARTVRESRETISLHGDSPDLERR